MNINIRVWTYKHYISSKDVQQFATYAAMSKAFQATKAYKSKLFALSSSNNFTFIKVVLD